MPTTPTQRDRAEKMRLIYQPEAFFRIVRNPYMTESNLTVAWINSSFPDKRGSTFTRAEEEGMVLLPDRSAAAVLQRKSRIEDKYQRK